MSKIFSREPSLISGAVAAVIALVVAFGVDLSADKVGAIMAVVAAVLALLVRSSVTPNVSVAATADPAGSTGAVAGPAADQPDGTPVSVVTSTL